MVLRPYQELASDFLYEADRAMILAPVGAGKTAITLTAMRDMLRDGVVQRFLVVAPKRVAVNVWPAEAKLWAPTLLVSVVIGTPTQRVKALQANVQVVVATYDNLQWLAEQPLHFDGVVFDELTRLKNPSGKRFKALIKVLDAMRIRWGLTGSFTSNGLEDVFGQCKVIDQTLWAAAKARFCSSIFTASTVTSVSGRPPPGRWNRSWSVSSPPRSCWTRASTPTSCRRCTRSS
jgi:superfamily II DNA or RNA helicase